MTAYIYRALQLKPTENLKFLYGRPPRPYKAMDIGI
jgi:hypothetical protein